MIYLNPLHFVLYYMMIILCLSHKNLDNLQHMVIGEYGTN